MARATMAGYARCTVENEMKKYWHVINVGIQNTMVYRTNFLFRSVFGLIPLFATISLWRAIFAGKEGEVAGYTLAQMTSYYLVITIVDAFTAVAEDDWQIAGDIKDGKSGLSRGCPRASSDAAMVKKNVYNLNKPGHFI